METVDAPKIDLRCKGGRLVYDKKRRTIVREGWLRRFRRWLKR
jgi:hypothetical protein